LQARVFVKLAGMDKRANMTPRRQCELALKRGRALVARWEDLPRRAAGLRELRAWLGETELAELCGEDVSRAAFEPVLAALEQRSGRRVAGRVTDAAFVMQTDCGKEAAVATMPLVVVCAGMRSAFNVGGVFRTVECFGGEAVWGCGYTAGPEHGAVKRAAMGTEQWVSWQAFGDATDAMAALREKGYGVVALETTEDAVALENFTWPFPCGLLLGNEQFGLAREVAEAADARVKIPMWGRKNSLNVVSALAVALHAARGQWEVQTNN
jgi:tRNA G18 (ribose-2'-O)-methylase SpoU